ncbi:MAG: hypothetical protein Q7T18_04855 [Sedimentisphaerales bacterium]|nr:hypothetical protein [Sedimentisphaerales bacterium]
MKTTGGVLKWVLIVIAAVIVLGIVVFLVAGNQLIKFGITKGASSALKVPVELGSINLSVLGGSVKLKDLVVHNPAGYELPTLMKLGGADVKVTIGSLMSDKVDIDHIILDNIEVSIEQKGFSTNLNDILKSLPKSEDTAPATSEPAAGGKKLYIKTLEINNVSVTAKLLPIPGKSSAVTFKIAPITMTDLGSDNKLDMAALTGKILAAIAEGVAKQGADLLPADVTGSLKSGLGKTGELLQGAGSKAGETGKKLGEGLLGVFKKKDPNSK